MRKWGLLALFLPLVLCGAAFLHVAHDHKVFNASTTSFLVPDGYTTGYTTEAPTQVPYRSAGTFTQFWCKLTDNSVTAISTLTFRVNGVDMVTIPIAASSITGPFEITTTSVTVNVGDLVSWKLVTGATGSSLTLMSYMALFNANSNSMMKFVSTGAGGTTGTTNGFANFFISIANIFGGGAGNLNDQTGTAPQYMMKTTGTFKNLSVYVTDNARTVPIPMFLRKNGSPTALTYAVPVSSTGLFQNTTDQVSVVSGDTVTLVFGTNAGSDGNLFSASYVSMEYVTTNGQTEYLTTNPGKQVSAGDSDVTTIQGPFGVDTLGSTYQIPARVPGTLSHMHFHTIQNSLSGNIVFRFRKNGTAGNSVVTVPAGQTGVFEDAVDSDVFVSTDQLDYSVIAAAGTGNIEVDQLASVITAASTGTQTANLGNFWVSDGGDKIPQEKFYPHGAVSGSTTTLSRTWDGTNATPFTAKGQTVGFEVIVPNPSGVDVGSVTVAMSSWTCAGGTGIVSTAVSSLTVTDFTTRPTQVFSAWYVQSVGMSQIPYGNNEYEERQFPLDLRVPFTVDGNNKGNATGPILWTNRNFHDLHLPIAWIPNEEFSISSQTIKAGQSQSYYVDTWVSTSIVAGQCTGNFNVYEGTLLSTSIPVNMKVFNFTLPAQPGFTEIVDIGNADIDGRINGNRSPSLPASGAFLTARNNFAKLMKAHNLIEIGDAPDVATNDFVSQEYSHHLDGTLYTAANGYGNARGVSTPDSFYMIGPYTSWTNNPNFSQTNVNLFCTALSSWSANLAQYSGLKVGLYGQDEVSDQTTNEKWATWATTVCALSGAHINMFVTGALPDLAAGTPHSRYPTSTDTFGNGIDNSSATWQTKFDAYNVGPDSAAMRYNSGTIGQGEIFAYEAEGYVPQANYWGYWKKLCPGGVCRSLHFMWEGNYFRDVNNGGQPNNSDNDLFNTAKTYGFDISPSTSSQFGHIGAHYSQGDGVLSYPGTDTVFANPSFGFPGAIAAFTLKQVRDGINTVDYLNMAYAVDPASTTAIVNSLYPKALWEVTCFDTADCTYSYGDRSWSYGTDTYVRARERLALIITSGVQPPTPTSNRFFSGGIKIISGGTKFR